MNLSTFQEAQTYLFSHIPKSMKQKFPAELGLARMQQFMENLGNPQEKYQVIHIAGTSGKGSTSTLISRLLAGQGMQVGLHLSPHLLDIRERIQVQNNFVAKEKFVDYLNEIMPAIEKTRQDGYGDVTYFEILVALAFYTFWKEKVEVAVIETGMGGLYDGTNVVKNPDKICVITSIGHDHTKILGKTLPEIAKQKAGIIHEKNAVIMLRQRPNVMTVFEKAAADTQADLSIVEKKDFEVQAMTESGTMFYDKKFSKQSFMLSLRGEYQAENAMLALAGLYTAAQKLGFAVDTKKIEKSFSAVSFPGRFDITTYKNARLIIDGAHNKQKMAAFLKALTALYPDRAFTFIVAFKQGKDIEEMITMIEKLAKEIVVTSFFVDSQDMLNISEPPETIAHYIKKTPHQVIPKLKDALTFAASQDNFVVATGSLYFASEIYALLRE